MRRAFTLLEALVSLALVLVVLGGLAAICSGVWRTQNFAGEKDLSLATEISLLQVARECAEVRDWQLPTLLTPSDQLQFRKLDPQRSHDPPQDSDRLPRQPIPLADSWIDDPALRVSVRYFVAQGQLWREQGALRWEIAAINPDFEASRLADGRVSLRYSYQNVRRSLTVIGILP